MGNRQRPTHRRWAPFSAAPSAKSAASILCAARIKKLTTATPVKKKTMALAVKERASQKASKAGWAEGGMSQVEVAAPCSPNTATETTPDRWAMLAV